MDQFISRLQRRFGRFAIHNLMIFICSTMLAIYFLQYLLNIPIVPYLVLTREGLLRGQIWRLITFVVVPPPSSGPFWLLFTLYFYYFIGSYLENTWGAFRFNLYYLFGIVGMLFAALISGYGSTEYLNLSLFLAFAQLFPNTEFLLFFFLPVKAKYLAYVDWALFALAFLTGALSTKAAVIFSILNFLLFFGRDFIDRIRFHYRYRGTRNNFRKAMRDQDRRGW